MGKSTDAELTDDSRQIETENMGITPCEAAIEKPSGSYVRFGFEPSCKVDLEVGRA